MLIKPRLVKSDNRTVLPKTHARSGGPELWFSNKMLSDYNCFGFSFNFFIDWSTYKVSQEVWIMRIATANSDLTDLSNEAIFNKIVECDGEIYLRKVANYLHEQDLVFKYILFQDSNNWSRYQNPILEATIDQAGDVIEVLTLTLSDLMDSIRAMSGGPVRVGSKGLIYSTSSLEAYLSKTNSLYPGDVDQIILNADGEAVAILEYKKHTLDDPIENQTLRRYYPNPDARKYDRIVMLRDYIDKILPIIVVYYPTKSHIKSLKLELIDGSRGSLKTVKTKILPLPTKDSVNSHKTIFEGILELIE